MRIPKVIYKNTPGKDSWCRWAVNRVMNRNNSTNIRLVGETGSGKSYSALYMGEKMAKMMGRVFTKGDIYFSVLDMIKKIRDEDPPPGSIFFLDEQQVAASNKEHQSKRNRAYSIMMSTIRSKRFIFISTLPFSDMADKQVRRLFHVEIETLGVDLSKNQVITKPRFIEYSRSRDKAYRKRLLIYWKEGEFGKTRKLSMWHINKPSQEIINAYEIKKAVFQKQLYNVIAKELEKYEIDGSEKIIESPAAAASDHTLSLLTPYQLALYNLMKDRKMTRKEANNLLIQNGFTSSEAKISMNIKWMKNKGVIILK